MFFTIPVEKQRGYLVGSISIDMNDIFSDVYFSAEAGQGLKSKFLRGRTRPILTTLRGHYMCTCPADNQFCLNQTNHNWVRAHARDLDKTRFGRERRRY